MLQSAAVSFKAGIVNLAQLSDIVNLENLRIVNFLQKKFSVLKNNIKI